MNHKYLEFPSCEKHSGDKFGKRESDIRLLQTINKDKRSLENICPFCAYELGLSDIPVVAGHPTSVSDVSSAPFMIDQFLIKNPSKTVLIPVVGDSMIDAGINEGDMVLVEVRSSANTNDIVVAIIDEEFTVKTLGQRRGKPVLLPSNEAYPTINPKESLQIYGVVVGLIRKYK